MNTSSISRSRTSIIAHQNQEPRRSTDRRTLPQDRAELSSTVIAFRKKVYRSIDELRSISIRWVREYNEARPLQGRWCFGKTPNADVP